MMILDEYKALPDFPFERYFESANQYISAQKYWLQVLRALEEFREQNWMPRERPVETQEDMYLGKVVDIISLKERKEISIQTSSVPGDANMLFKENSGISQEDYREQKKLFGSDFELDEGFLKGMTYEQALGEAQENAARNSLTTWVEAGIHWQPDSSRLEQGYEIEIERLILTARISEDAEAKALRALDLFLQPGPALERVNQVFVSVEE